MNKIWCRVFFCTVWETLLSADACGSSCPDPPPHEYSLPMIIWYNEHHRSLKVDLILQNVPPQVSDWEIYETKTNVFRSIYPKEKYHVYRPKPKLIKLKLNVPLSVDTSTTAFVVSLKSNSGFCNTDLSQIFLKIVHTQDRLIEGEKEMLRKPIYIPMDWNHECKNISPVNTGTPDATSSELKVFPTKFKDDGQPFAVFNCTAHCSRGQVLAWYQDKINGQQTILMVHQDKSPTATLTLNKTLENGDQGTNVYCARRVIMQNPADPQKLSLYLPDLNTIATSRTILLNFSRLIETEVPQVIVDPNGIVSFEPNTTMEFICTSRMVDGRGLSWYEKDTNSTSRRLLAPIQNPSEGVTSLKLYLNESYLRKSIYCVQEQQFAYQSIDDKYYDLRYGEIARSDSITFRKQDGGKSAGLWLCREHQLMVAGACVAVTLLILLLAGVIFARRRRSEASPEPIESDYVVPQVTYAVLALPETDSEVPKKEKQNYVEIVGVYKNKTNKK